MTQPDAQPDDDHLIGALADYLEPHLGPVRVEPRGRPGSGFSAENLVFDTVGPTAAETRRWVLRRESAQDSPYPEQAPGLGTGIALQHSVTTALRGHLPVADVLVFEADPAVLGAPFFVMGFVDGVVPTEDPPCTVEGFYADGPPALRRSMIDNGLAVLGRLHDVAWREGPLAALVGAGDRPGAARQLDLWDTHLRLALRGRDAEVLARTLEHLHATVPAPPAAPVLLWGDARLGNIIWDPASGAVRCVTDFEGAAVGEPELDLGWWLMADRWMHEGSGAARLPGEPSRAEQVAAYEASSGRRVGDLGWYELFAAMRFAVTVVHVLNRWEDAGLVPADHTIWFENPATDLIRAISAESGALTW